MVIFNFVTMFLTFIAGRELKTVDEFNDYHRFSHCNFTVCDKTWGPRGSSTFYGGSR
ncbi:hypothetical protein Mapa_002858 [Marchantia paleacea]|nr:hypothetical protein Mapa_002858 [Marchantia paleacea]